METTAIETNELLLPEEVAKILRVTVETVRNYIKDKTNPLPTIKITSSTYRIRRVELMEWLKSQPDPRQDV